MNGDISLSQSFGGLRIANPDNSSPDSARARNSPKPSQDGEQQPSPLNPQPNGTASTRITSIERLPSTRQRPISPTNVSGGNLSTDGYDSYAARTKARQSIPYTYQDQQQQQFPQYPTMMPQNLHDSQSNASRAVPNYYTAPPNSQMNAPIRRDNSYRLRSEPSQNSMKRSNSRGGSAALQAGVPTRDNSHSDRTYGRGQYMAGNGPVPPRRGSRGMGGGHIGGSSSNGNTPLSSTTQMSGSPYGIEGGPLSSSEEWKERGAAVKAHQDYDANGKPVTRYVKKGVKDFSFGRTLGEGSYSTVLLAQDRQTHKEYAIKILDKRHIIKEKKVKYVNIEKNTLNRLTDHPGIVRLYYTFQDERSLYFVLDLASGGELLGHLKRVSTFNEECTRFYGAQILDTIDYMHRCGIIHRDLKPENVLLDDQMHVKITDFGTAKILNEKKQDAMGLPLDSSEEDGDRAESFVGTAEYVSPELLTEKNACKASDLWAFGCIIYQLLAGRPPFKAGNEYQTFQKIVALDYEFPRGFPDVARDLVERLLVLDPGRRLSIEHIKNHQFFDGITWGRSLWQQKAPRLKPYVPPAAAPIKLDGPESYPPNITPSHTTKPAHLPLSASVSNSRPQPRVITELPPPSQLDIEWSPVLTRNNERILKLGNLNVTSSATSHSPHSSDGGKLSRLFGGTATKKKQRLVMVTSSARVIMAPPGGEDKRMKSEIPLLHPNTICSSGTDPKGVTHWIVDTPKCRYIFEDPKPASGDMMSTAISTQEWLDIVDRAKEIAVSQSTNHSYSNDELNFASSNFSSHANTLDRSMDIEGNPNYPESGTGTLRNTLVKNSNHTDAESLKARKRFSKRQSKSGLAAVF